MRNVLWALGCIAMLGAASSSGIDVSKTFARIEPGLASRVKIAVLLPARLPTSFGGEKLFPIIDRAGRSGYAVDIALSADCKGEHACSGGHVYGSATPLSANDVPAGGSRVQLNGSVFAIYRRSVIGPYPSDAYLSWKQNGAYYAVALNTGSLADILLTARSMR
jgi:hypothetical protein